MVATEIKTTDAVLYTIDMDFHAYSIFQDHVDIWNKEPFLMFLWSKHRNYVHVPFSSISTIETGLLRQEVWLHLIDGTKYRLATASSLIDALVELLTSLHRSSYLD